MFFILRTTDALLVEAGRYACRCSKYAAHAWWLPAAYSERARCSSGSDARTRSTSSAKWSGRLVTSGSVETGTPPALSLHRPGARMPGGAGMFASYRR